MKELKIALFASVFALAITTCVDNQVDQKVKTQCQQQTFPNPPVEYVL